MRFIGDRVYRRATGEAGVIVEYVSDKYRIRLSDDSTIVCLEHEIMPQYVYPDDWKQFSDRKRANLMNLLREEPRLTRADVLTLVKNAIAFPFPQICKHTVAANLLSMLEKRGEPVTESFQRLVKAVTQAKDEDALEILENDYITEELEESRKCHGDQ